MPRNMHARESRNRAKAKRDTALARDELRTNTVPRSSAAGVTSLAVKVDDPTNRALIDEFLRTRMVDAGGRIEQPRK